MKIATAEIPAKASASASRSRFESVLALLVFCPTLAFACWTVACHICVIWHLSFQTLCCVGLPALLCGAVAGGFLARSEGLAEYNNERNSPSAPKPRQFILLIVAAAIVASFAFGIGYSAFWICAVGLLTYAVLHQWNADLGVGEPPAGLSNFGKCVLFLLVIFAPIVTYVAHRPDVDDAVYVGTAADAVAHPELAVLSHDVLYGDQKFPLMLPSYAVESYELLIALLAHLLGGSPIFWAHAVVPTILAALVPIAWFKLMRILAPRHSLAATVLASLLLSLPAEFRGFGNFAFVRLFQGKAVFVSIAIPLLFCFCWEFIGTGRKRIWILLLACAIASVGLTASAIFVVPLALGGACLSRWRTAVPNRVILASVPALYPLLCGLAVSHGFKALEAVFAQLPARAPIAIAMVFGTHTQYFFLLAILAAPFLEPNAKRRWSVSLLVLAYFVIALNPFAMKLLSRFTTRDAVWRVLWCLPVAGIASATCINSVQEIRERWGKWGTLAAAVLSIAGLIYFVRHSSFAPSNDVTYSLHPLKVVDGDYAVARTATVATPPGTSVLAPENIAVWIPTFVHRPSLVSVREIYDAEMGTHLPPEEARTRRQLRELVSGKDFPEAETDRLVDSLPRYEVGLAVAPIAVAQRLQVELSKRNQPIGIATNGYVLFRLDGGRTP
jgi:hypothetical protein